MKLSYFEFVRVFDAAYQLFVSKGGTYAEWSKLGYQGRKRYYEKVRKREPSAQPWLENGKVLCLRIMSKINDGWKRAKLTDTAVTLEELLHCQKLQSHQMHVRVQEMQA